MRVQVDESRRNNLALGLKQLVGVGGIHLAADLGDDPILDPDVSHKSWDARPIHDCAAANQYVKLRHLSLLALATSLIGSSPSPPQSGDGESSLYPRP